jgi:DNA-directed RNA polymerase subunit E'/Rpb7
MDPLFERRELVRNVHIEAKHLQRNIHDSLLAQLRHKHEGTCVAEGYINQRSIQVVEHSLGRINLIKGGMDYVVKFQADLCMPHPGQVFRATVALKSKIGIHADLHPMKTLLPRDLHIGNGDFEDVEDGQEIEFEVIGSRFQQGDDSIVVLAKLRNVIQTAAPGQAPKQVESSEPVLAAPMGDQDANNGKKVVTVDLSSTKSSEGTARRKKLRAPAPGEGKE